MFVFVRVDVIVCQAQRYSAVHMDKGLSFEKGMNGPGHALVTFRQHLIRSRFVPQRPDDLRQETMLEFGRLFLETVRATASPSNSAWANTASTNPFSSQEGIQRRWRVASIQGISVGVHPCKNGVAQDAGPTTR